MKHINSSWDIKELIDNQNNINPKPQYQRSPVWTNERKSFLIDSILRGYDLPKFYVKTLTPGNNYRFEVADGQQRMRAIWGFYGGEFSLPKNTVIDKIDLSEYFYDKLPLNFKTSFQNFTLSFNEILESKPGEINELFKRLQKGVSLNPPELRHAMYSEIGFYINNFLEKKPIISFFKNSKVKDLRFKHQDYVDHIIALMHFNNTKDLKAILMTQLYFDFEKASINSFKHYFSDAENIIKKMDEINNFNMGIFKNKWAFVDYFWLLFRNLKKIQSINIAEFANQSLEFETERMKFNATPEKLLRLKRIKFGESLYNYIQAFNKEGAKKENINIRASVLDKIFVGHFK